MLTSALMFYNFKRIKLIATNYKLINLIKMTQRILEILDNVRYWETCPNNYKQDIETFLNSQNEQLPLLGVRRSLPIDTKTLSELAKKGFEENNEYNFLSSIEQVYKRGIEVGLNVANDYIGR